MVDQTGLSVSDVVNVTVSLSPLAAVSRNFGLPMILSSEDVIDTTERKRQYSGITAIATDFGVTSPTYLAAVPYFAQDPQPDTLIVGRWAQFATSGRLHGAILAPTSQVLSNFTGITNGGLKVSVDGVARTLSNLNFSAALNLNGVAYVVQQALQAVGAAGATVTWNASYSRFDVVSGTTGSASTVGYATSPTTGTDVSVLLGLSQTPNASGSSASPPVVGIPAESLASCFTNFSNSYSAAYGFTVATAIAPSVVDIVATAALVEAADLSHIFGVSTQDTAVLDSSRSDDIASVLQALNFKRTFVSYSSSSAYSAASIFGRAFTVDFTGINTTITLKFKQEPGIAAEQLNEDQAAALRSKNCNAFVEYQNGTAILQEGVMCNGYFFDEVHGTDWLQNYIQINVYNRLYQSQTKIPQTDAGVNELVAAVNASLSQGVVNGLMAPGIWNLPGFGTLRQGDTLPTGFYVDAESVDDQSQADREKRVAPPIKAAIKLAGAIHFAGVAVQVNR